MSQQVLRQSSKTKAREGAWVPVYHPGLVTLAKQIGLSLALTGDIGLDTTSSFF